MNDNKRATVQRPRKRPGSKNTFTTKSGSTIKLHQSLTERYRAHRDAKARRRAAYMSTLPKNRFKRILYRMKPRELARYWFSRDGAIMALKIAGVGFVVGFLVIVGTFAYFRKDLPDISVTGTKLGGSITYYDRTGQTVLWQDYDAVKRQTVAADKIAQSVKDATVAIEDKDFYKHGAFDVRGILRAGLHDVFSKGGGLQGGSTISQQLVKLNLEWSADRTIARKVKEVILAVELEREYSKQDILTGYLNIAPYGPVENGVQVAAKDYFGIDAKDLTLAQSAMLAAIPQSPNIYSPYGPGFDKEALIGRQHYVLDQMAEQHMITKQQATDAKKVDIMAQVQARKPSIYTDIKAPYFVLAAKEELEANYGKETVKRGGWKVITTVDINLQQLAEKAVATGMPIIKNQRGDNAAFVAEDNKTGQIVALVGGADFFNGDFKEINYAKDVNISPGSTFKPYDYAAFIENRTDAGAGTVLYDDRTPPNSLPSYPCTSGTLDPKNGGNCLVDYDWRSHPYPGPVTLRYSLGGSRNVPAMKAMLTAVPNDKSSSYVNGINKTIHTAEAMMGNSDGYRCYDPATTPDIFTATIENETQCYGSSAIGDGSYLYLDDHVNGIATLARLGKSIPRTYILKITDSNDKTLYEFKQPAGKQVLRPDTAYIVNDMASDPNASYLPGSCNATTCTQLIPARNFNYKFHRYNGWNFAIKTGTTNDGFDGLMASWSTQYTAIAWVGHHSRTVAMSGNMETMTEPIVRLWMQGAHDALNTKPVNWQQPAGVKKLPAFVLSHKVSNLGEIVPSPGNDLFPSWYQPPKTGSGNATIDQVSNKLATSCTPELAKKNESGGNANAWSADEFNGIASSSTTTATDDVHNCNDARPNVSLTTPATCKDETDCLFTVTVSQGTWPLSDPARGQFPGTVNLLINGQKVDTRTVNDSPSSITFKYKPTTSGDATIQAQVIDSVLYSATDQTTVNFH